MVCSLLYSPKSSGLMLHSPSPSAIAKAPLLTPLFGGDWSSVVLVVIVVGRCHSGFGESVKKRSCVCVCVFVCLFVCARRDSRGARRRGVCFLGFEGGGFWWVPAPRVNSGV